MGVRTVYGLTNSENGWRMVDAAGCSTNPIPGTTCRIPLQTGVPNTILKAFAADLNVYVESVYNQSGINDEGGWTATNSVASSNHLSGTAFDYNWNDHPMGVALAGWHGSDIIPGEEEPAVRALLDWYEGMVFWGNDWNSPKDSMHFQMGYNTYTNQAKCNDFIKRKIRADGFSTYRRVDTDPPDPQAAADPVADFQKWKISTTDRKLLEYIAEQLGPGHPAWASKPETVRDQVYKLVSN